MDGATLSLLTAGHGEPVVLLHGIPTGAELWRPVVERLADRGLRVLAPDLPGYGGTRLGLGGDYSLAGAAHLLARWLRGLSVGPAWVVGHDAGGAVAQMLAVDHADVVSRITLVNSIVEGSWPAPRARFATTVARIGLYAPAARLGLVPNAYIRWGIRQAVGRPEAAGRAVAVVCDSKFGDADGRREFQRHLAALAAADTAPAATGLPAVDAPCQLVWGMADPYQPWEPGGVRLRNLLPSADVTKLADCGHFVPLECGDRLVEAMLQWWRKPAVS